jgi:hypothetical protein
MSDLALIEEPDGSIAPRRVRLGHRASARLRGPALDHALARGVSPDSGVALTLRAGRLIRPHTRRRLARSLRGIAETAEQRVHSGSHQRLWGPQVAPARQELLALAESLESTSAVDARGIALVRVMLTDGGGPLHTNRGAQRLIAAAREASAALSPMS